MSRLRLLGIFFFFFLNASGVHGPLHAMNEEKEFRAPLTQPRSYQQNPSELDGYESLATSFAKLAFGTMLIYTCPFNDLNEVSWGKTLCSMFGIQLIQESLYDLGSSLYESWRQKSIQGELQKLEQDKNNLNKRRGKSNKKKDNTLRQIEDKISHLSRINPQEEFIHYTNYLNCASTILQTMFIGWRTIDLIYKNTVYTFFPRKSYTLKTKKINKLESNLTALAEYIHYIEDNTNPHISLVGTCATFVDSAWSLYNLYKYWNGEVLGQDTPLKCLVSALSSLNGSVLYKDQLVQYGTISGTKSLHSAIKKSYIKTSPPVEANMTVENFFTAVKNSRIKLLLYDSRARKYCIEYIKNYLYYSEKFTFLVDMLFI